VNETTPETTPDDDDDDYVSRRVDVSQGLLRDDKTWQTPEAIESLREIIENLETSSDSISGWSSYLDQKTDDPNQETNGETIA